MGSGVKWLMYCTFSLRGAQYAGLQGQAAVEWLKTRRVVLPFIINFITLLVASTLDSTFLVFQITDTGL
jgi:hypothetical protein